jgi:hypothetical protein
MAILLYIADARMIAPPLWAAAQRRLELEPRYAGLETTTPM